LSSAEVLTLVPGIDQGGAAVELIDDLEDASSRFSAGVCATISLPIRRCASARTRSGMNE